MPELTEDFRLKDDLSGLTPTQQKGWEIISELARQQEKIFDEMIGEPVWRSADGRVTPMSKMTDTHLRNSIKMLERYGHTEDNPKYPQLKTEWEKRHPRRVAHRGEPSVRNERSEMKKRLTERLVEEIENGASWEEIEQMSGTLFPLRKRDIKSVLYILKIKHYVKFFGEHGSK